MHSTAAIASDYAIYYQIISFVLFNMVMKAVLGCNSRSGMDKISSFSFFSNDVGLKESPRAVPDPGTLLRVLSPDMFFFVVLFLFFSRFYLISFQIYLFICLSVCPMVAMLMSVSIFFE